jgi:hypothetical protein
MQALTAPRRVKASSINVAPGTPRRATGDDRASMPRPQSTEIAHKGPQTRAKACTRPGA